MTELVTSTITEPQTVEETTTVTETLTSTDVVATETLFTSTYVTDSSIVPVGPCLVEAQC